MQDCIHWSGSVNDRGYGYLYVSGKQVYAHRKAYEDVVGPIPDGLVIDHLCRNRSCVNVAHMEPVSIGTNVMRGDTNPARNKAKTHCLRGHSLEDAYVSKKGKRDCPACRRIRYHDNKQRNSG